MKDMYKTNINWNTPSFERRKNTCYDCDLFLADFCDGDDDDIKTCEKYEDCFVNNDEE